MGHIRFFEDEQLMRDQWILVYEHRLITIGAFMSNYIIVLIIVTVAGLACWALSRQSADW